MQVRSTPAKPKGGFDDGLSQALSLVVGPVVFALLGALLDRELGTSPVFLIVFGVLGFLGACVSLYFRYQAAVSRDDAGKPWSRRQW